jgi:tRNA pseudouridine55 synthase
MDGLLIVDKPSGPTSHDVVATVRRVLGERRVGHTGTLDPIASGVLPLVLGRATRLARFLSASEKSYRAVIRLGLETDSYDLTGEPASETYMGAMPDLESVERALASFRGTFLQQPPLFSAKKIAGVRSHRLARQHRADGTIGEPAAKPVNVNVSDLQLVDLESRDVVVTVTCSAGFYVRSLAHDLGRLLGTGAHLAALRRTHAGDLRVEDAIALDTVLKDQPAAAAAIVPMSRMLTTLPVAALSEDGARRAKHGQSLGPGDLCAPLPPGAAGYTRLVDRRGELVGVAELEGGVGFLHPVVILV